MSVTDVAPGTRLAAERGRTSTAYILGSENLKWPDLHKMLSELCGVPGPFLEMNCTSSYLAAMCEEVQARLWRRSPAISCTAKMVGRYYWYSSQGVYAWLRPTSGATGSGGSRCLACDE